VCAVHVSLPTFGIGLVSICQGTFDSSAVTCRSDLSSRMLTVYVPYHNAKPGQTILRNEWAFNGKVVQKADPHFLRYERPPTPTNSGMRTLETSRSRYTARTQRLSVALRSTWRPSIFLRPFIFLRLLSNPRPRRASTV